MANQWLMKVNEGFVFYPRDRSHILHVWDYKIHMGLYINTTIVFLIQEIASKHQPDLSDLSPP